MTTEANDSAERSGLVKRLLGKIFVLPTMLTALAGAAPTALDMYKASQFGIGIANFRKVAQAEEQQELWKKNFFCSSKAKVNTIKSKDGVTINVLACPSGDVLTTVKKSDKVAISKWITVEEIQTASLAMALIGQANAATGTDGNSSTPTGRSQGGLRLVEETGEVKCQDWAKPGKEVNRVIAKGDKCFFEKVNVLTGKTLETKEVPCDTKCTP